MSFCVGLNSATVIERDFQDFSVTELIVRGDNAVRVTTASGYRLKEQQP
ncbi:MAG: hypothetical protein BMS9Abin05_0990 [Rhodothermia bacterium]|nr:MAG: hypothetical protein BMS9Abin05_0990 [Rhodothermia bacterium]